MPRVFLKQNVFDAALERIERLFHEFPTVVVNFSGGKDSTVVLNLTIEVAKKLNRLPVPVRWLDQEAEWDHVVQYNRSVMHRPEVQPYWFQGPFRLFNATRTDGDPWLHCWREGDEANWIRPKEPDSIHENVTGCDRFFGLFEAMNKVYWPGKLAVLTGVRAEESPARLQGLVAGATYKEITWGKLSDKKLQHYTFHPLYDWSFRDVWKAIHANGWEYCKIYDYMYNFGIPVRNMRVSNVHHETAIGSLKFLQELEPDTWNKILERVSGANAVKQAGEAYTCPAELPFMFQSWREYRDHLLDKLILDPKVQDIFRRQFANWEKTFTRPGFQKTLMQHCIAVLLVNDFEGTKHGVFAASHYAESKGFRKRADQPINV